MNKNKIPNEQGPPPPNYKFYLGSRERYIHISSDFESGNIQLVRQLSEFNYRLSCIDDGVKTNHRVNSKSWFYFRVHGFPKNTKGKFTVSRVQTLMAVYVQNYLQKTQAPKSYRPVYRQRFVADSQWSGWSRISTESPLIMRESGELQVVFQFPFKNEEHEVEFAFAYPYTYSKNIDYLNTLNEYYCNEEFYFHKEVLIHSPEKRMLHLLTITSHDQQSLQPENEEIFDQALFPERCRPKRFKKPVILISARVHPGQTAASYTMEGIINFLINNKDLRSFLLKKMFVFMIVPMINVDGVYHGHFRMDNYGKNLNRYYLDPSIDKQPSVYAIKELANHLIISNRLSFYFDLHAHNAKKGAFIYGNAINDFVQQVESQVFCKLFALNHSGFEYQFCNFSQKQMNSKDRNEQRTKQGCGRVVMHRMANIIHSYSLQCGIISATKQNIVPLPMNSDFKLGDKQLVQTQEKNASTEPHYFTQLDYEQLGKAMLVSILDVFDKNPYNRVYNSNQKSMEFLRRVTAFEVFHTAERFRMFQKYVYGKVKNINELIKQVLNSKLHYRQLYNFYFYNDKELKNTEWPQNISGLVKPKFTQKIKRLRSLQEPKMEYSLSFLQDLKANRDQLQHGVAVEGPERLYQVSVMQNYQRMAEVLEECPEGEGPQDENSDSSQTWNQEEKRIENQMVFYEQMMEEDREVHSQTFLPLAKQTLREVAVDEAISSWSTCQEGTNQPWLPGKDMCSSEKDPLENQLEEYHSQNHINFYNIDEVKQISRLKFFQRAEDIENVKINKVQSPSMRVRRLLKNEAPKKLKMTPKQMKGKLGQMIANSPQVCHNSFAASNTLSNYSGLSAKSEKINIDMPFHQRQMKLFEEIKHEIKEELKRHKERSGLTCTAARPQPIKHSISQIKQKQRIRSTNPIFNNITINSNHPSHFHQKQKSQTINRHPSKSCVTKTQLPALNSHILIISSNSSKGLNNN